TVVTTTDLVTPTTLRHYLRSLRRGKRPVSSTPATSPFPSRLQPSAAPRRSRLRSPRPSSSPAPAAGRTPGTPRGGPPPNAAPRAPAPPSRPRAFPSAKLAPVDASAVGGFPTAPTPARPQLPKAPERTGGKAKSSARAIGPPAQVPRERARRTALAAPGTASAQPQRPRPRGAAPPALSRNARKARRAHSP